MSTKQPLRVLFISHLANLQGGSQQSLLSLMRGLDRARIEPLVLVPREAELSATLRSEGIPYRVVPFRGWVNASRNPAGILYRAGMNAVGLARLRLMLRNTPLDAIYTNTLYSPIGALLARQLKLPHLWHAREFIHEDMHEDYDFGTTRSLSFAARNSALIVCNSGAIRQKLAAYMPDDKLSVIYNGILPEADLVSTPRSTRSDGDYLRLLNVGRISAAKNQADAVRALRFLLDAGIVARLRLVGKTDPQYGEELRALIADLQLGEYVDWQAFTDAIMPEYAQADVTLVCSRAEAFGRVAVEALASGCPVVAAHSGGLPEIITDGENGLLYAPGEPAELTAQITRLQQNTALYQQLSAAGLEAVRARFTVERYVEQVTQAIEQAVAPH